MLDPLLSPEEKAEQARLQEEAKKQEAIDGTTAPEEVSTPAMEGVSFDVTDSANPMDDVSFDIGGLDIGLTDDTTTTLPEITAVSDADAGTFLSGGTVVQVEEVDTPDTDLASIALLQGATAMTSESIMDSTEATGILTLSEEGETEQAKTEESIAPETVTEGDTGIFSMMDDVTPIVEAPIVPEAAPIDSMEALIVPETVIVDELALADTRTTVHELSIVHEADGALQDMLTEFIGKLEALETDTTGMNQDIESSLRALVGKRDELHREFEIREQAIAYEEKQLTMKQASRAQERIRLEKIIRTLRDEVAV